MGVFQREAPENGEVCVSVASLGGVVCDGLEEVLRGEGVLGKFVCGGV